MEPSRIPGIEPLGEEHQTWRLILGLAIYLLALVGLIAYLRWKLPRTMDEPPAPPDDSEGQ